MITEMLNQMITELTATVTGVLNLLPILVLIMGATIFYLGYASKVNKS